MAEFYHAIGLAAIGRNKGDRPTIALPLPGPKEQASWNSIWPCPLAPQAPEIRDWTNCCESIWIFNTYSLPTVVLGLVGKIAAMEYILRFVIGSLPGRKQGAIFCK